MIIFFCKFESLKNRDFSIIHFAARAIPLTDNECREWKKKQTNEQVLPECHFPFDVNVMRVENFIRSVVVVALFPRCVSCFCA